MSASRLIILTCDHPDCDARIAFIGSRLGAVRGKATELGWQSKGDGDSYQWGWDRCPLHPKVTVAEREPRRVEIEDLDAFVIGAVR